MPKFVFCVPLYCLYMLYCNGIMYRLHCINKEGDCYSSSYYYWNCYTVQYSVHNAENQCVFICSNLRSSLGTKNCTGSSTMEIPTSFLT